MSIYLHAALAVSVVTMTVVAVAFWVHRRAAWVPYAGMVAFGLLFFADLTARLHLPAVALAALSGKSKN